MHERYSAIELSRYFYSVCRFNIINKINLVEMRPQLVRRWCDEWHYEQWHR